MVDVNTPLIFGSGLYGQTFDLGGVTYKRGVNLGDKPLLELTGTLNVLRNWRIDDSNLSGVTGTVKLGGTDNYVEDGYLDNCIRYGMFFNGSNAVRCGYRRITIRKCQHGISGGSGSPGQWAPSVDCVVEDYDISGMQIDGIKLKNMLRTIVRRNKIDVYPFNPEISSKSGVYFAATDAPNDGCIVEDNIIYQSSPASGNRAVLVHPDADVNGVVVTTHPSANNVIRNNDLRGMSTGVWLRKGYGATIGSANYYQVLNNKITSIPTPYDDDGIGNVITPYNSKSLAFSGTVK
jgi:hypothetical protein